MNRVHELGKLMVRTTVLEDVDGQLYFIGIPLSEDIFITYLPAVNVSAEHYTFFEVMNLCVFAFMCTFFYVYKCT